MATPRKADRVLATHSCTQDCCWVHVAIYGIMRCSPASGTRAQSLTRIPPLTPAADVWEQALPPTAIVLSDCGAALLTFSWSPNWQHRPFADHTKRQCTHDDLASTLEDHVRTHRSHGQTQAIIHRQVVAAGTAGRREPRPVRQPSWRWREQRIANRP